jgi:F-type H+-transporting ATPase subunit b
MPQLDVATYLPQIFWLVITFAVLYLIVARVALPRVGEVLEARQERIEADFERAEGLRKEAEDTLAAYEATMDEARAQAHRVTVEATQAMAAEAARRNEALTARLAEETAAAEARIADASRRALAGMRDAAKELVREASSKLAGVTASEPAIEAALAEAAGEGTS